MQQITVVALHCWFRQLIIFLCFQAHLTQDNKYSLQLAWTGPDYDVRHILVFIFQNTHDLQLSGLPHCDSGVMHLPPMSLVYLSTSPSHPLSLSLDVWPKVYPEVGFNVLLILCEWWGVPRCLLRLFEIFFYFCLLRVLCFVYPTTTCYILNYQWVPT